MAFLFYQRKEVVIMIVFGKLNDIRKELIRELRSNLQYKTKSDDYIKGFADAVEIVERVINR